MIALPWGKIIAAVALVALLAAAGAAIRSWDKGRLAERYNAGRNEERHLWEEGQRLAKERQDKAAREATAAAEAAGDTMRAGSAATASKTAAATQADVDTLIKAHTDAKTPACVPDGPAVALPAGVLDALKRARGRASRTATATSR